jgi:nucleoside-diphosphate-sugar epimerase
MSDQIFITGTTGCIGHYVIEEVRKQHPSAHLHLFAIRPERFKIPVKNWNDVTIHPYSLNEVDQLKDILPNMDYVIHIATVWGYNLEDNIKLNRDKTLEMFNYLNPTKIKRIIYFSTASILGPNNTPVEIARTDGIPYVQSKYDAYLAIKQSKWTDKVITLFPTVVLGGDDTHPYSHISTGLNDIKKHIKWARWLSLNGSFHFLHAADIASVTVAALTKPNTPSDIVLGNPLVTFNQTITELCKFFNKKNPIKIPIASWFILLIITLFRIKVDNWAKHCIRNPHFKYNVHNPTDFDRPVKYPTITSTL